MIVSAEGSDYKPTPEGTFMAVCTRVVDLGTQVSNFAGQEKAQRKVLLSWEIPEVETVDQDGQPRPALISSSFTASLHEKASLRKVLKSWRGRDFTAEELKGFDMKNVLGAGCLVSVVHTDRDGKTFANVETVMGLPKGMPKPTPAGELINFDLDAFEREAFDKLSPRLREKIEATPEFKAATGEEDFRSTAPGEVPGGYDYPADYGGPDDIVPF